MQLLYVTLTYMLQEMAARVVIRTSKSVEWISSNNSFTIGDRTSSSVRSSFFSTNLEMIEFSGLMACSPSSTATSSSAKTVADFKSPRHLHKEEHYLVHIDASPAPGFATSTPVSAWTQGYAPMLCPGRQHVRRTQSTLCHVHDVHQVRDL